MTQIMSSYMMCFLKKMYVCVIFTQQTWEKLCHSQEIWSILKHAKCSQTFYLLIQFHLNTKMTMFCILMKALFGRYLYVNKQNIKCHTNRLLRNNHQISHLNK